MILTIGPGGSGLSFLTWSIIFLRGDNLYKSLDSKIYKVTNNPIKCNGTAHGFEKDHINQTADLIKLNQTTDQSVVYVALTCQSDLDYILQFDSKKIIFNAGTFSEELMARMYYLIPNNPYVELVNRLSSKYAVEKIKQVLLESNKFFTNYYAIPAWYSDHFSINYFDIFQNLDHVIHQIFEYLDITILSDRMDKWIPVYQEWKNLNKDYLHLFKTDSIQLTTKEKTKILKDIIEWKNGLYRLTWQS
jgi:hypothetical protein